MAILAKTILISFMMTLMIDQIKTAVITVPPVSATAPIYTTAIFTCEGTGDILNWLVQSAELTDSIEQQREISVTTTTVNNTIFSSVLTVNAIPINDGLGIGCEIISYNLSNPSNPFNRVTLNSELTIRGISPVEDIQYSFTTNNLLITWSPPDYYSNDIPHGSPVSYQVLVIDKENEDIILDTNTLDTNITVPNITQCDTFNVTLTALVDQYESINNTDIRNNGTGYVVNITTNKDNFLTLNLTIELSCPPSKSNTSLTITSGSEVVDEYRITGTDGVVNDTRTLETSKVYYYTVRVFNLRDKFEYETYTIISTYQVIGLYINNAYTSGSVSVQCVFVSEAFADGCHVTFNDTNGMNITRSTESILVTLPAGSYNASAYDIVNQSYYGPAVIKAKLFHVQNLPTSTSSIIMSKSTTPPLQSTVIASPTVTETPGTETPSSITGKITNDANILIVVAGTVGGIVVIILFIIIIIRAMISFDKRKKEKIEISKRSEIAISQQSQAEPNDYQEFYLTVIESPKSEGPMNQCDQHLTSTTTQETTFKDSISSTTSNDTIHDTEYTTDPPVRVNVSNDNTTATVAPTYASIAKTDTTVPPADDQTVEYNTITGDIYKRGGVKFCHHDNASNIVTGNFNSTTGKDEVAADLSDSPTAYNDSDTTSDPVSKCSAESPQASSNGYTYSKAKEESHTKGASSLCVTPPVEQPKDDNTAATFQFRQHSAKPHQYKS